jgi:hypothetical protein
MTDDTRPETLSIPECPLEATALVGTDPATGEDGDRFTRVTDGIYRGMWFCERTGVYSTYIEALAGHGPLRVEYDRRVLTEAELRVWFARHDNPQGVWLVGLMRECKGMTKAELDAIYEGVRDGTV